MDLLLVNCNIATMSNSVEAPYGAIMDGAIAIKSGRIAFVGSQAELPPHWMGAGGWATGDRLRDLQGAWVTPGLIDCHRCVQLWHTGRVQLMHGCSHIVYGGNRSGEWELKLNGASYEEVAKAGGGIVNTVRADSRGLCAELLGWCEYRWRGLGVPV